jgi:hypothetical protein
MATPVDPAEVLSDIDMLDPELLPNYTLTFRMEATGIPDELDEEEDFSLLLEIRQSSLENYHLLMESMDVSIEIWVVDGTTYMAEDDGAIMTIPGTDMGLFSPSMFLTTIPPLVPELEAARVGEERVSGRQTTRYQISAQEYLALSEFFGAGPTPADARGEVVVWIDNELNIMIRQEADLSWTNDDGTSGSFISNYLVSDIGTTSPVEAPQ